MDAPPPPRVMFGPRGRRSVHRLFAGLALAVVSTHGLGSCGGGGGGSVPPPAPIEVVVDLGVMASTVPATVPVAVTNPFAGSATATLAATSGPAAPASGELPATVPGGGARAVSLVVTPGGTPGLVEATVSVLVTADADGTSRLVTYRISGVAESINVEILTTTVDFGEVPTGTTTTRTVSVRNASVVSPTTVTSITVVGAAFSTDTLAPVALPPGAMVVVEIVCAPTTPGTPTGTLGVTALGILPRTIPLSATSGGIEVLDLGTQTFDGSGYTPIVDVTVSSDAISFFVEAEFATGSVVGLGRLETPQGIAYENEAATGAYFQWPDQEIFGAQVPSTDQPSLVLVSGTWRVRLRRFSGSVTTATLKVHVQRRPGATGHVGRLDLNVFFSSALTPDAASASTNTDVSDILSRVNDLYAQQGITLGDVAFYDIADTTFDDVTQAEFPALLRLSSTAAAHRMNYFFVRTAIGGGVLGIAAKIGGGTLNGTSYSGVMGLWIENPTASQRDLVARVMAHEMGHFLGLFHTTESNGSWDSITDTVLCPASGCTDTSQRYLMHWNAGTGGSVITGGQGLVLRGHPLVAAATPPPVMTLRTIRWAGEDAPLDVSPLWCGTCTLPPEAAR